MMIFPMNQKVIPNPLMIKKSYKKQNKLKLKTKQQNQQQIKIFHHQMIPRNLMLKLSQPIKIKSRLLLLKFHKNKISKSSKVTKSKKPTISPLFKHKNHKYQKINLKTSKIKNKTKINKTIKERRKKIKRKTRKKIKIKLEDKN